MRVLSNHADHKNDPTQTNNDPAQPRKATRLSDVIPGERQADPNPIYRVEATSKAADRNAQQFNSLERFARTMKFEGVVA